MAILYCAQQERSAINHIFYIKYLLKMLGKIQFGTPASGYHIVNKHLDLALLVVHHC